MTKLQSAYNEFIADFCERHGECQATRDEAHEIADKLAALGGEMAFAVRKFGGDYTMVENVIDSIGLSADETYLIAVNARESYDA